MRQGDGDVVCPSVSFNLGCRGVTATLEFACPCREARRVIGGVCPIGTRLLYKVDQQGQSLLSPVQPSPPGQP